MHCIRFEPRERVAVVAAEGEVDAFVAPDLDRALTEAQATGSAVVVDLGSVSFLDSTALGLVVRHVRELTEHGRAARIVFPRGSARRIFEITTLDRVLPEAPSMDAALAELAPDPGAT